MNELRKPADLYLAVLLLLYPLCYILPLLYFQDPSSVMKRKLAEFLKQKLPFELCAEIEALTHDLKPVMAELKETHKQRIPAMLISTKSFYNLRFLRKRYRESLYSVSYRKENGLTKILCEIGKCESLHKTRFYRYVRQPRWRYRRSTWREIGVLL